MALFRHSGSESFFSKAKSSFSFVFWKSFVLEKSTRGPEVDVPFNAMVVRGDTVMLESVRGRDERASTGLAVDVDPQRLGDPLRCENPPLARPTP